MHSFLAGIVAINGSKMNRFDALGGGRKGETYVQYEYEREQIPNHWRYAEEFTLGDAFSSSSYGPTWTSTGWGLACRRS